MKNNLFFLALLNLTLSISSYGQNGFRINFDNGYQDGTEFVTIDTISNADNIWQIGIPSKSIFNSADSPYRAICTDTVSSYPSNDTSVFIISHINHLGLQEFSGSYFVNSDSLSDYGKIEISPNNGATWIDFFNDTNYSPYLYWWSQKPVFTGNSNGWNFFDVQFIGSINSLLNISNGDTILIRITFISDNIQTNKDGLMFDSFSYSDDIEGTIDYSSGELEAIYPNPADNEIFINKSKSTCSQIVEIFDSKGQLVYKDVDPVSILTNYFKDGLYFLRIIRNDTFDTWKLEVQH
jgi:hypothetical protein